MRLAQKFHLAYCSNIHPGETWEEIQGNLFTFLPTVRQKLSPTGPFGLGLRLSAQAAETLEKEENLSAFQQFLADHKTYVFTINGFPYGTFHGTRVKEAVYLPDWRDQARLDYTTRLARILAVLLPDQPDLEGSVSTVPGAFKNVVKSNHDVHQMSGLMLKHVAALHTLKEETGKTITLGLEPEPGCYLETVDEVVAFFRDFLFGPEGVQMLAAQLGVSPAEAEAVARHHIGICFDACHMAVEFEAVTDALEKLKAEGIKICKFQITSALRLQFQEGDGHPQATLSQFAEDTYLHQVVEKSPKGTVRFTDLPEALAQEARTQALDRPAREKEWRVHFHVPVFLAEMEHFGTTQDYLVSLIDFLKQDAVCPYLEVETYTWDVLPPQYRTLDTASAIARELAWVRDQIQS